MCNGQYWVDTTLLYRNSIDIHALKVRENQLKKQADGVKHANKETDQS